MYFIFLVQKCWYFTKIYIKARNAAFLSEGISRQAEQLFSFMFDGVKLSQNHDVYIRSSAPFNTLTYRKTPCQST